MITCGAQAQRRARPRFGAGGRDGVDHRDPSRFTRELTALAASRFRHRTGCEAHPPSLGREALATTM
jgi:hypothetical protein